LLLQCGIWLVKAGGSTKTDAEIVAHVLATAPNSYDSITTLVLGKDLTDPNILKFTREQYRSYWKRHFESQNTRRNRGYSNTAAAYAVETKHKSEVNFVAGGQRNKINRPVGKPWKKFKGFCKNCSIQGHKAVNCHTAKKKNSTGQERKVQVETRKCFSCNKTGHLARDCPTKKADTAFVGCILSYKPPDAHDKEIIEKLKSEDFELKKK
jgi:Zinc knuckle